MAGVLMGVAAVAPKITITRAAGAFAYAEGAKTPDECKEALTLMRVFHSDLTKDLAEVTDAVKLLESKILRLSIKKEEATAQPMEYDL